jgi:outer membrane lipoprotein-sorting protein
MLSRRQGAAFLAAFVLGAAPWASGSAAEPASALAAQVRQRLLDAPVLRGQFEQRKTVRGFKSPLVSRGDFLVARDRGVVWHTREPFASTLTVTRERLQSRQADGTVTTGLSVRDEPGLRGINETLFALMSTDIKALEQRFHITGDAETGKDTWRLALTPRDAVLGKWVTRIELEGDRFLRSVRMTEAQGDTSVINFTQQTTAPALTRQEEAGFE